MVQKTITADVILVDKLDSATINKLGKKYQGQNHNGESQQYKIAERF